MRRAVTVCCDCVPRLCVVSVCCACVQPLAVRGPRTYLEVLLVDDRGELLLPDRGEPLFRVLVGVAVDRADAGKHRGLPKQPPELCLVAGHHVRVQQSDPERPRACHAIGRGIGLQAPISITNASNQHGHEVEAATRRVWGGTELEESVGNGPKEL